MTTSLVQLAPWHFDAIIALGNEVHGENYLDPSQMEDLYAKSWSKQINASWVAVSSRSKENLPLTNPNRITPDGCLVGFRLTISAGNWMPDKWCTPKQWQHSAEQVCYFKCNTIDSALRGQGLGSRLLEKSIGSK
jgi:ribosomal protein S18 acetylase RimI-like enzyme